MNSPIGGKPLANFGSPGRMDTDQDQAPLYRGKYRNLSPHDTPPRGVTPRNVFQGQGKNAPIGGKTLEEIGLPELMETNQGRTKLGRGGHRRR